jgi:hypothetical protein
MHFIETGCILNVKKSSIYPHVFMTSLVPVLLYPMNLFSYVRHLLDFEICVVGCWGCCNL